MTLTNTREYTEDKNGNVQRRQNKGDVVFEGETVVGSWVIQKWAKAKSAKEQVRQPASGSRAERSKRTLDVDADEDDKEDGHKEEEGGGEDVDEGFIVKEHPLDEEVGEKPKKYEKGTRRRKKTL